MELQSLIIVPWVVIGLVVGMMYSSGTHSSKTTPFAVAAMLGAIAGGWIVDTAAGGVSWNGLFGALVGAFIASAIYHAKAKPRKII